MQLAIKIDGQHVQGSPFHYDVVDPSVANTEAGSSGGGGGGSGGSAGTGSSSIGNAATFFGGRDAAILVEAAAPAPFCPDAVMGNTPRRVKCIADNHPVRAGASLEGFEIGSMNAGTTFLMSGETITAGDGIWVLVDKSAPLKCVDPGMQHLDAWILQSSMAGAGGGDHVDEEELEDRDDGEEDDSADNDLDMEGAPPMPGLYRVPEADADNVPEDSAAGSKAAVFLQEMDGSFLPAFYPMDAIVGSDSEADDSDGGEADASDGA